MQIVIKIPEKVYSYIKLEWVEDDFDSPLNHVMNGVKNGIPIPKEHGKVWEENDIKRSIKNEYQLVTVLAGLKMVKPIIEAESE